MRYDEAANRRKYVRAHVAAIAKVWAGLDTARHFLVRNLSAGGALLSGQAQLEPGAEIQILLDFVAVSEQIDLSAEVLRCESDVEGNALVGVAFRKLDASVRQLLSNLVLNEVSVTKERVILIADTRVPHLRAFAQGLRKIPTAGILLARTPLEVLRALYNNPQIRIALIGRAGDEMWAIQMLSMIADDFPRVRRVLVCSREESDRESSFLLSRTVQAVLPDNFTTAELVTALETSEPKSINSN